MYHDRNMRMRTTWRPDTFVEIRCQSRFQNSSELADSFLLSEKPADLEIPMSFAFGMHYGADVEKPISTNASSSSFLGYVCKFNKRRKPEPRCYFEVRGRCDDSGGNITDTINADCRPSPRDREEDSQYLYLFPSRSSTWKNVHAIDCRVRFPSKKYPKLFLRPEELCRSPTSLGACMPQMAAYLGYPFRKRHARTDIIM